MSAICNYCSKNEIGQLRVSTLYLFREQTYRGRCIVALNEHETEFFHLSQD
jgi:hypothetical protein